MHQRQLYDIQQKNRPKSALFGDLYAYTVSTTLTVFLYGDIIEQVIGE
jgi:hypothetical protein